MRDREEGLLKKLELTVKTARYLRAEQIFYRIFYAFRPSRYLFRALKNRLSAPNFSPEMLGLPTGAEFLPPGPQNFDPKELENGYFTFVNSTSQLGFPPDWRREPPSLLWHFNLHYFEWLWALDYPMAKRAVSSWIKNYSDSFELPAWHPYPTSLRLQNWTLYFFSRHLQKVLEDREFLNRLWESIYFQGEWLFRNLEFHLGANHLLENAATLSLLGGAFRCRQSERWLERGNRLLNRELAEQVPPDGLHYERSPMYHCRILYLLLTLDTASVPGIRGIVRDALLRGARALQLIRHPDGEIPLFNDSAFGIYNSPAQLLGRIGDRVGRDFLSFIPGPWSLPYAGYYGYRDDSGNFIICDAGEIGPRHNPGHAHADIFSFEMSIRGYRVFTDTGIFQYSPGPKLKLARATRSHNTAEISGMDQCEFWSAFRVANRPRIIHLDWMPLEGGFVLTAEHDAYSGRADGAIHRRRFSLSGNSLEIVDVIRADRPVDVKFHFHFHPQIEVRPEGNRIILSLSDGEELARFHLDAEYKLSKTPYFPMFGREVLREHAEVERSGRNIRQVWKLIVLG